MITSADAEYKATKLLKQGKETLEPAFAELAAWIGSTYKVNVLNVIYDEPSVLEKRPRLQVIVEHTRELESFSDELNFDPAKQRAIADRFADTVSRYRLTRYRSDGILVVFAAFARLAREEADSLVSDAEVDALKQRIANPDLWTIHRLFGRVTFMFYTNEQARRYEADGSRDRYANLYFGLLESRDEFGYLERSRFSVEFDSKENFDETFKGSWFYYER